MFFSIIVPVYNIESYLKKCIESVLIHPYANMELILVNDGSSDESGNICDKYALKDNRVTVIHKANSGVSDTRNVGINRAKGDYILFLDGDDYWNHNILSELERTINLNNSPDLIFTNTEYRLFSDEKYIEFTCGFNANEFNRLSGESTLEHLLTRTNKNPFSVWRNIYKSSIIKENNLEFEKGVTLGEDADWLFKFILYTKKNLLLDVPFYVYRMDRIGSAMATKSKKSLMSYLYIIEKWIDYYNKNQDRVTKIVCSKLSNNYVTYFKYIYSYDKEFCEQLIRKIVKSDLLEFVDSASCIEIRNEIYKKGFEKVLKRLNFKWIVRRTIKSAINKSSIKIKTRKRVTK